ncbi:MAG: hypothetical protein RR847_04920 [Bacilli bacterium]
MGIATQKINEVEAMAKRYGLFDQNGNINGNINVARKVMEDNGGFGAVESALKKANSPIVKTFLGKIGINTEAINGVVNELKSANNGVVDNVPNNNVSEISDRLNKLK